MTLQRLVMETKPGEPVIRAVYRSQDGPNHATKAQEVTELARTGVISPDADMLVKGAKWTQHVPKRQTSSWCA